MRLSTLSCLSIAALVIGASDSLCAENWPQWRGPDFNGVSHEKNVPVEWSKDKNVAWRVELPGSAGATPVAWDDQIFLTSVDGEELLLICIGTDGKEQWRRVVGFGNQEARGDEGNSASPSPCTDGKHVWSFMGTGDFGCFTVEGEPVWNINLQERFGEFDIQFGMSSTPVLHNGKLLVQLIHGSMRDESAGEPAIVAALDAATGETLWKVPRITGAVSESRHSYASPVLYDFDGLTQLITHGGDFTIAYDPESGEEIWRLGSFNPMDSPDYNAFLRFVSSPGIGPGVVICPTAKNGATYAVRPDSRGALEVDGPAVLWSMKRGTPDVPTPLVHDGLVYLCNENGILQCIDAKTGEQHYQQRTHGVKHRASPIYADGHVYLTARDGRVTVVKAGTEFGVVAQNETDEVQTATPVIHNGTIYLRTFDALWAIRQQ